MVPVTENKEKNIPWKFFMKHLIVINLEVFQEDGVAYFVKYSVGMLWQIVLM